ncbi:MAG: efflux RND transporter periplasmic adaptor subunit [Nevskiaceae bacterium]|nr:efflux RND transporter periplasmic adaptor subunit [Nevskiaceae bacterium]
MVSLSACGGRPGASGADNAQPVAALTVTTTPVRNEEVARQLQVTGSVFPWQDVIIGSEVGGYRVAAVLVDVGSPVKKDQVLVRLADDLLQAELDSRRAALRSAEASQVNAAAALRRGESISSSGLLSAADLDTLRAQDVDAKARVETATADLRTAELRARYANVTAPDSGTITSRTVSVGQIAQAGAEMLRMLRQDRVEWRAEVPEAELKNIAVGQSVALTAVDGTKVSGTVRAVSPTVQASNRTGLVYVDITAGMVRPGMFARGEIQVGKGNALLLPVASVVMQDGYSYVFVLGDNDIVTRHRVEPVGVRGDYMEIASGVEAGNIVAVKGAGFLKDGDTVNVAAEGS